MLLAGSAATASLAFNWSMNSSTSFFTGESAARAAYASLVLTSKSVPSRTAPS